MNKDKILNLTQEELQSIYDRIPTTYTPHRFGYKSFWYSDYYYISDFDVHLRIGQSYATVVTMEISTMIDGEMFGVLYELGKYSTTTSKQVTQFYNQLSHASTRVLAGRIYQ